MPIVRRTGGYKLNDHIRYQMGIYVHSYNKTPAEDVGIHAEIALPSINDIRFAPYDELYHFHSGMGREGSPPPRVWVDKNNSIFKLSLYSYIDEHNLHKLYDHGDIRIDDKVYRLHIKDAYASLGFTISPNLEEEEINSGRNFYSRKKSLESLPITGTVLDNLATQEARDIASSLMEFRRRYAALKDRLIVVHRRLHAENIEKGICNPDAFNYSLYNKDDPEAVKLELEMSDIIISWKALITNALSYTCEDKVKGRLIADDINLMFKLLHVSYESPDS